MHEFIEQSNANRHQCQITVNSLIQKNELTELKKTKNLVEALVAQYSGNREDEIIVLA
jgi:hypothetical protein